jgi:hypothetical protein
MSGYNFHDHFHFNWFLCSNFQTDSSVLINLGVPITVAAPSKARTVFARSNTGIVGSNLTRSLDICVRLFCVCVALYM